MELKRKKTIKYLLDEIRKQAKNPTASDPYIGNLYKALLVLTKEDKTIIDLIIKTQEIRARKNKFLTISHALYLILGCINYLMIIKEKKLNYPYIKELNLNESIGWVKLIKYLLNKYKSNFFYLMKEKNYQQNIIERGVGIPFIAHKVFKDKKLKVADLGCSENLVWAFLASKTKFQPIIDHTKWENQTNLINKYSKKYDFVKEEIGIEQVIPHKNREGIDWLISCRHPKEVKPDFIKKSRENIEKYKKINSVKTIEGSILNLQFKNNTFDIITINNVLYQLPMKKRKLVLYKASQLLNKETGLLIIQDNCFVNTKNQIVFTNSRKSFTYRVCITGPIIYKRTNKKEWLELLRYKSTRCTEVKSGKDFERFTSLFSCDRK